MANKDLLELFKSLIEIPTLSSQSNLDFVDFLSERLKPHGGKIFNIPSPCKNKANLVCWLGPMTSDALLISGHIDTVPVNSTAWNYPPFKLTQAVNHEGQKALYGRGTADMKAFIAQAVYVLESLDISQLKRPIVLAFTCDEEIGCLGAHQVIKFFKEDLKLIPSYALVGEPTEYQVCVAHKGHTQMSISIKGVEGHSSKIDQGVSAIHFASNIINYLRDLSRELRQHIKHKELFNDYPFNTLNIGVIKGGRAVNIIAGECCLEIGYRTLPGDDPEGIYKIINQKITDSFLPQIRSLNNNADIECKLEVVVPPMLTEDGGTFEQNLRDITGNNKRLAASYTTEGGVYSLEGIKCLICGPGSIEQAHRPDEYILSDQLDIGVNYIQQLIERMCL